MRCSFSPKAAPAISPPPACARDFCSGYASGIVWYLGSCYWIYHAMHVYGGVNAFLLGRPPHPFCALPRRFITDCSASCLPSALASGRAIVCARSCWRHFFGSRWNSRAPTSPAFPGTCLAPRKSNNVPLARIATFTGVYGVSFEIALVNAAFAAAALVARRQRVTMLIAAVCASVGLQVWQLVPDAGAATRSLCDAGAGKPARSNDVHWDEQKEKEVLRDLEKFSVAPKNATAENPGLIVWPESPAPFFVTDYHFRGTMMQIAHDTQFVRGGGQPGHREHGQGRRAARSLQLRRADHARRQVGQPVTTRTTLSPSANTSLSRSGSASPNP